MTACADYAEIFEREFRPRTPLRRAAAWMLWAGLLAIRPRLALQILRERGYRW